MSKCALTQERLRELLDYDPETGLFTWRVNRAGNAKAGSAAGCAHKCGYRQVMVDSTLYLAHRLAWFYVYNVWPPQHIDHINGVRDDNRIANLREATYSTNNQNRGLDSRNTSGYQGVYWSEQTRKWYAQLKVGNKRYNLGYFIDIADAAEARASAKEKYHTFHVHGRDYNKSLLQGDII